jgi:hypothetical protein
MPKPSLRAPGYCSRCATRGHERYVYANGWRRCHADGWKQAVLALLDEREGARFRRYSSGRTPADRWTYGCDSCNADDADHSAARRCGRDCCTDI